MWAGSQRGPGRQGRGLACGLFGLEEGPTGRGRGRVGPVRCSEQSRPASGRGQQRATVRPGRGRHGAGAALRDPPEPRPHRLQPRGAAGRGRARVPAGASALPRWARVAVGRAGGVGSGGGARSRGWAGTPGSAADVAESGPPPRPLARPGARMGATRVPRVLGVLGGRRAAFGAEQGSVFRFCPSCPLRPGEGWEPVHFGRAHWTGTRASLQPSLPGLQGPPCPAPAGPLLGGWAFCPTPPAPGADCPTAESAGSQLDARATRAPAYTQSKLVLWTGVSCSPLGAQAPSPTGIWEVNLSPPGLSPCWCTHLGLWDQVAAATLPSTLHRCRPLLCEVSTGTWVVLRARPSGWGRGSLALSTRLCGVSLLGCSSTLRCSTRPLCGWQLGTSGPP